MLINGLVIWAHPWRSADYQLFYMLGDHGLYCPVNFDTGAY